MNTFKIIFETLKLYMPSNYQERKMLVIAIVLV